MTLYYAGYIAGLDQWCFGSIKVSARKINNAFKQAEFSLCAEYDEYKISTQPIKQEDI